MSTGRSSSLLRDATGLVAHLPTSQPPNHRPPYLGTAQSGPRRTTPSCRILSNCGLRRRLVPRRMLWVGAPPLLWVGATTTSLARCSGSSGRFVILVKILLILTLIPKFLPLIFSCRCMVSSKTILVQYYRTTNFVLAQVPCISRRHMHDTTTARPTIRSSVASWHRARGKPSGSSRWRCLWTPRGRPPLWRLAVLR